MGNSACTFAAQPGFVKVTGLSFWTQISDSLMKWWSVTLRRIPESWGTSGWRVVGTGNRGSASDPQVTVLTDLVIDSDSRRRTWEGFPHQLTPECNRLPKAGVCREAENFCSRQKPRRHVEADVACPPPRPGFKLSGRCADAITYSPSARHRPKNVSKKGTKTLCWDGSRRAAGKGDKDALQGKWEHAALHIRCVGGGEAKRAVVSVAPCHQRRQELLDALG